MDNLSEMRIKSLEATLEAERSQLDKWKSAVADQLRSAEQKTKALVAENNELRGHLDRAHTDSTLKVRTALLKEFNERYTEKEQTWATQRAHMQNEIESLQERLRAEEGRVTELMGQRGVGVAAEDQVTILQAMLGTAKADVRRYQLGSAVYAENMKTLQDSCDKEVEEVHAQLRHKSMQLEMLQRRLTELENHNATLIAANTNLTDESREREDVLNDLFRTQHKEVFTSLLAENESLRQKLATVTAENQIRCAELEGVKNEMLDNVQEVEELRESTAHAVTAMEKAKAKANEAEVRLREALREITQLKISSGVGAASRESSSAALLIPPPSLTSSGITTVSAEPPRDFMTRLRGNGRRYLPWMALLMLILLGLYNSATGSEAEVCKSAIMKSQIFTTQLKEMAMRLDVCRKKCPGLSAAAT